MEQMIEYDAKLGRCPTVRIEENSVPVWSAHWQTR